MPSASPSSRRPSSVVSENSPLISHNGAYTDHGTLKIVPSRPIPEDRGVVNGDVESGAAIAEEGDDGAIAKPLPDGNPDIAKKMKYLLPAVGIGIFLSAADQTIIVSTYPKIGSDLNALNSTSWIATAYFLTLTTFQPLYGKFSDIFGRKPALLIAYTIFGLGCLFCGMARTMPELIAARAFAGIGGGGMTTVVSILMSDVIPLRQRGKWQGFTNIIFASGGAAGAPLGGLLADSIGWRWAFLGQAPMCLAAFIAVSIMLKLTPVSHDHWLKKTSRIDFGGAITLITATSALLVGLDFGSNGAWSSPLTIGLICAAAPLFAAFFYIEHTVSHPFAPFRLIFSKRCAPPLISNFFAFGGYMAMIFYVPLYFQAVSGLNSAQAGMRLIPGVLGTVTGSVGAGYLMQKTGKYYWLTVTGYSMMVAGQIGIMVFSGIVATSMVGIILSLTCTGFGGGIAVTTTLIALIANVEPGDQAIITACSYLFRSLGSAVGVSLAATVVQWRLRQQLIFRLGEGLETDKIVQGVRESLEYLERLSPEIRLVVVRCYEKSVQAAYAFAGVVLIGAVAGAVFLKEKKL